LLPDAKFGGRSDSNRENNGTASILTRYNSMAVAVVRDDCSSSSDGGGGGSRSDEAAHRILSGVVENVSRQTIDHAISKCAIRQQKLFRAIAQFLNAYEGNFEAAK
jgi:hypothetical protein